MRSGLVMAAAVLLGLGCGDRAATEEAAGREDSPGNVTDVADGAAYVPTKDTPSRDRMLESVAMRCTDGTEVLVTYWDQPEARVVLSSEQGFGGVLPRLSGDDEDAALSYGDSTATWTYLGDSAVYRAGSRRLVCQPATDIVF